MLALLIGDTLLVLLLGVLVAGLLRSHADIARALHELGVPLGDPAKGHTSPVDLRRTEHGTLQMGPAVPPRAAGSAVFDIDGSTPAGDAVALAVSGASQRTLLAFLSSGCVSCAQFWTEITSGQLDLPGDVRPVIVTKGPESEQPHEIARMGSGNGAVPVVMSSDAWADYEVPGSPFFVLVDGPAGMRSGEGTARSMAEVTKLVRAASDERSPVTLGAASRPESAGPLGHRDHVPTVDEELREAGILPGDPSLYPRTLDDVIGGRDPRSRRPPSGR